MLHLGQASSELMKAVVGIQRRFISDPEPGQAFRDLLTLVVQLSGSGSGFLGKVSTHGDNRYTFEMLAKLNAAESDALGGTDSNGKPCELAGLDWSPLCDELLREGRTTLVVPSALVESDPQQWRILPCLDEKGSLLGVMGLAGPPEDCDDELDALLQSLCELCGVMIDAVRHENQERAVERKLAEAKLSESRQRLELALAASRMGVWEWDVRTNQVFWSPECQEIMGIEEFEGTLDGFAGLVHPEDAEQVLEQAQRSLTNGNEYSPEFRLVTPNGEIRWLESSSMIQRDSTGEPLKMVGTVRDITERKRAEEALQASEARYRTFVDHATDTLILHDQDGRVVDVNRQACDSLGYNRDELIGMYPRQFDSEITPDGLAQLVTRLDAGESIVFESRQRRKNGATFPVEVHLRPFWMNGRRHALSLSCDISERKRVEEKLSESEAKFLALVINCAGRNFHQRLRRALHGRQSLGLRSLGQTRGSRRSDRPRSSAPAHRRQVPTQ